MTRDAPPVVIDTNVLIAANGRDCPQVTPPAALPVSNNSNTPKPRPSW
ncbi:hypothetical protein [Leptolyngbya sp. PCC 6406]|nr:hypothetical protein [Leptolyngbya sp. PCC 6406]